MGIVLALRYLVIALICNTKKLLCLGFFFFFNLNFHTLLCMISWTVFQVIISCVYRAFELPIFFILCSKFIKIYDNTGNEVFGRRGGCHSRSSGQSVELPFGGSDSITLVVSLSPWSWDGYARIQYTVLDKAFGSGNKTLWQVCLKAEERLHPLPQLSWRS